MRPGKFFDLYSSPRVKKIEMMRPSPGNKAFGCDFSLDLGRGRFHRTIQKNVGHTSYLITFRGASTWLERRIQPLC